MSPQQPGILTSPLGAVLPNHQFSEYHYGLIDAPAETVWAAVHALQWRDLRLGRPLMMLRSLGTLISDESVIDFFVKHCGATSSANRPLTLVVAMIGKPWSPVLPKMAAHSLGFVHDFDEPGWLKYGMEWLLEPLSDGRTLIETRTLCEATDAAARRAFKAYWTLIRPGSSLLRYEMIAAIRRLCH